MLTEFRDELARFPVIGSTRRDHIDRWIADPRVQEIWVKLNAIAPDLQAKDFIHYVLMLRQLVGATVPRKHCVEECNSWRIKYQTELKHLASSPVSDLELASQQVQVAEGLRANATVLSLVTEVQGRDFTRPDRDGSAARTLFELELGRYFQEICGRWLDWEVAALTEIAFAGKVTSEDEIRKLRRPNANIQVNQHVPPDIVSIVPDP
jgi:hypothetical protein